MAAEATIVATMESPAHVPAAPALLAVVEATLRDLQTGCQMFAELADVGASHALSSQPLAITAHARRGPALPVGWVL